MHDARLPLVLIHGGSFAGSCWDPLLPHLAGPVLAVDLPGRGRRPADLRSVTLADCADSVVADIDEARFDRVVVVGHSLAGATMPFLVERLGDRIAGMVFVACSVPPDGAAIVDTLDPAIREMARAAAGAVPGVPDPAFAVAMFGNGLDDEQLAFTLAAQVPEAPQLTLGTVPTAALDAVAHKAWILCEDDAIVSPEKQRAFAALVGAEVVELAASHMAMIHRPAALAAAIEPLRAAWS